MSVESDIKNAVEQGYAGTQDGDVRQLRTEIHAAIFEAFRALAPGKRWSVNEVRLVDIVDHWIDSLNRKG